MTFTHALFVAILIDPYSAAKSAELHQYDSIWVIPVLTWRAAYPVSIYVSFSYVHSHSPTLDIPLVSRGGRLTINAPFFQKQARWNEKTRPYFFL